MRIKHIYITKEGEPMANPEMEYPKKPSKEWDIRMGGRERNKIRGLWKKYENRLNKYHSGLLPFENKDQEVESFVWDTVGVDAFTAKDGPLRFKPDTLIPVDLEVEVVEYRVLDELDKLYDIRKVLRIKP